MNYCTKLDSVKNNMFALKGFPCFPFCTNIKLYKYLKICHIPCVSSLVLFYFELVLKRVHIHSILWTNLNLYWTWLVENLLTSQAFAQESSKVFTTAMPPSSHFCCLFQSDSHTVISLVQSLVQLQVFTNSIGVYY